MTNPGQEPRQHKATLRQTRRDAWYPSGHAYDDNRSPDTMYGPRPWSDQARYSYAGPFAMHEDRVVQQALSVMELPAEEIQEIVGAPLSMIDPFPARQGYERTDVTVEMILGVERNYPTKTSWYSGSPAGASGSSRNTLGDSV